MSYTSTASSLYYYRRTHFFLFFYSPKTECRCRRIESRVTKTLFLLFFFFSAAAAVAAEDLWVICCCSSAAAAAAAEVLCLDTLNLQIHNCETAACLLPLKISASVTTRGNNFSSTQGDCNTKLVQVEKSLRIIQSGQKSDLLFATQI